MVEQAELTDRERAALELLKSGSYSFADDYHRANPPSETIAAFDALVDRGLAIRTPHGVYALSFEGCKVAGLYD